MRNLFDNLRLKFFIFINAKLRLEASEIIKKFFLISNIIKNGGFVYNVLVAIEIILLLLIVYELVKRKIPALRPSTWFIMLMPLILVFLARVMFSPLSKALQIGDICAMLFFLASQAFFFRIQ